MKLFRFRYPGVARHGQLIVLARDEAAARETANDKIQSTFIRERMTLADSFTLDQPAIIFNDFGEV